MPLSRHPSTAENLAHQESVATQRMGQLLLSCMLLVVISKTS
jgi:hypothetical protein